jgi:hypothetical protein
MTDQIKPPWECDILHMHVNLSGKTISFVSSSHPLCFLFILSICITYGIPLYFLSALYFYFKLKTVLVNVTQNMPITGEEQKKKY